MNHTDKFKHTTRGNYAGDREIGIDLFDDETPEHVTIYVRFVDGTRSPARDVFLGEPEHAAAVLEAWTKGKDVRDYRGQVIPAEARKFTCAGMDHFFKGDGEWFSVPAFVECGSGLRKTALTLHVNARGALSVGDGVTEKTAKQKPKFAGERAGVGMNATRFYSVGCAFVPAWILERVAGMTRLALPAATLETA